MRGGRCAHGAATGPLWQPQDGDAQEGWTDALTKGSELDTEALLQRLRLHLGSGYTATWVEQNLSLTRLIASMVVHPNTEEKRRPPDDHGIVVTVADQLKRAAPAKEKRYVDGWLAVNSSEMGLVAYLLWQARQRSWVPVKSGRITGERGTFRLVLGAQPALDTLPIESSLGWLRAVTQIREVAHPAPSIGSAVDYLEQFLSSEGLSAENLTPSSGRLYRDGAPFAIIRATKPFEVWTVDREWHTKERLAPARYGRAVEGSR